VNHVGRSAPALLYKLLGSVPRLLFGTVGWPQQLLCGSFGPGSREAHQSSCSLTCPAQVVLGRHRQSVRRPRVLPSPCAFRRQLLMSSAVEDLVTSGW